jgi:DNA ligase-4
MDDKLDGERLVIHKIGKVIKLFTRRKKDTTDSYNYGTVLLPIIMEAIGDASCVIDCELLTWDKKANAYGRFGTNRTTAIAPSVTQTMCISKCLCLMLVIRKPPK